jgi:DNA-binding HxlR family transcriptional regulator
MQDKIKFVGETHKSVEKRIDELNAQLKAVKNKDRRKILELCSKEPKTISQLKRALKSSLKVTWHNIKQLEKAGFVVLEERKKEQYHPVYVTTVILPSEIVDIFDNMWLEKYKIIQAEKEQEK